MSEASKIRNQCAKKYGVREKAYKEQIVSLTEKIVALEGKLFDYEEMQRNYVKLCLFCGLSTEARERVLKNQSIEDSLAKWRSMTGLDLTTMQKLAITALKMDADSLDEVIGSLGV